MAEIKPGKADYNENMPQTLTSYIAVSALAYGSPDWRTFTYSHSQPLQPGQLVLVPWGKTTSLGVVAGPASQPNFATKAILEVLDLPPLPPHLIKLAGWLSQFYFASPGSVWQTMLPSGLTKQRRQLTPVEPSPVKNASQPALTRDQAAALEQLQSSDHAVNLVYGVTGSGKTRVYLELARATLASGHSVIVLVPEIALTPQLVEALTAQFAGQVIVNHSKLTESQRHRAWLEALNSHTPKVVIGPRSSLFLPVAHPGLIVIDECHETSYKQDQNPRYWAITVAAQLANLVGAKVILGSATPGLWEVFLAKQGRIGLARLGSKVNQLKPARARIIDLRDKTQLTRSRWLSDQLLDELNQTLTNQRQSILFLNRRGSASSQICADCGHVTSCAHCHLPLTFHADRLRMICHSCGLAETVLPVCPDCHRSNLKLLGSGTKRIEAEVTRLFPTARLARLDKDSANLKYLEATYRGLRAGEIDILIGTQMVAKGFDLPAVDTVGIVSADTMLHIPDFSAAERTYQLLSQVSGRTGRGDRPGQVIIQTYTPDHPAITAAAQSDFWGFVSAELAHRRWLAYPPYIYLLKLTCQRSSQDSAEAAGRALAAKLAELADLTIVGPAPAWRDRVGAKFQWQLIVKSPRRPRLVEAASLAGPGWSTDLDPINLL